MTFLFSAACLCVELIGLNAQHLFHLDKDKEQYEEEAAAYAHIAKDIFAIGTFYLPLLLLSSSRPSAALFLVWNVLRRCISFANSSIAIADDEHEELDWVSILLIIAQTAMVPIFVYATLWRDTKHARDQSNNPVTHPRTTSHSTNRVAE